MGDCPIEGHHIEDHATGDWPITTRRWCTTGWTYDTQIFRAPLQAHSDGEISTSAIKISMLYVFRNGRQVLPLAA